MLKQATQIESQSDNRQLILDYLKEAEAKRNGNVTAGQSGAKDDRLMDKETWIMVLVGMLLCCAFWKMCRLLYSARRQ